MNEYSPVVILESPFAPGLFTVEQHLLYAQACLLHSIEQGEAPLASHLIYTQVLDDHDPKDRQLGIECGMAWLTVADYTVVYTDLGVSSGMQKGIENAFDQGLEVIYRAFIPADDQRATTPEETWRQVLPFLPRRRSSNVWEPDRLVNRIRNRVANPTRPNPKDKK